MQTSCNASCRDIQLQSWVYELVLATVVAYAYSNKAHNYVYSNWVKIGAICSCSLIMQQQRPCIGIFYRLWVKIVNWLNYIIIIMFSYLQLQSSNVDCGVAVYPLIHENQTLQTTLVLSDRGMYCECQVLSGYRYGTSLVCSVTVTMCDP